MTRLFMQSDEFNDKTPKQKTSSTKANTVENNCKNRAGTQKQSSHSTSKVVTVLKGKSCNSRYAKSYDPIKHRPLAKWKSSLPIFLQLTFTSKRHCIPWWSSSKTQQLYNERPWHAQPTAISLLS